MDILTGTFTNCSYFNALQGQSAFYLKPNMEIDKSKLNDYGQIKCVGKFCLQQKMMPLYLAGEWKQSDGKAEFHFSQISEFCQTEQDAISLMDALKDNSFISYKDIKAIVKVTGPDIFSAASVENIEAKICEEEGADIVSVTQIFSKIRSLVNEMNLFKVIDNYGGYYEHCAKAMKKFPENAMDVLMHDSYRLFLEANLPFTLVDKIALDNGVEPLSEARIKAVLLWCIRRETNAGNVFMKLEDICGITSKIFGNIPNTTILAALEDHPYITRDDDHDVFYEKQMLLDEKLAAVEFARLMRSAVTLPYHPEYIDLIEEENGRKFGSQQRDSFQLLRSTGVKLLTGDPGTGKTTTVNGLLRYLEILWEKEYGRKPKFALCAPSGRASQRMKETTNRNALTVHKLLEYQPYGNGDYYKDKDNPIDADVVVVDEVSMLGLSTYSKLIAAIKSGSLVLLVGDTNQLQSVEPGSVLADIQYSGFVDHCNLTEVFRQAKESLINVNAKKIICGDETLREGPDFELIKTEPEKTQEVLLETAARLIKEAGDPNKVQCLAPVKKGSCGIFRGNNVLQDLFNPGKNLVFYGSKKYRIGDRVIMMSNNYALNYYNGDVGYIKDINDSGMKISIGDEMISLPKEQYGDMDLAYSCTIHKSQGSEYEYLVIVLQEDARGMLDQNLFYTGVTRGKKKVVVVYENDCVKRSIRTKNSGNRNSLLMERMTNEMIQAFQK